MRRQMACRWLETSKCAKLADVLPIHHRLPLFSAFSSVLVACSVAPHSAPDSDAASCTSAADAGTVPCQNGQRILFGAVVNARDLGGTALAHSASVAYGALYRGAPLNSLSAAGCDAFAALGIGTVIDLRVPSEVDLTPNADCVTQTTRSVSAPLPVPSDVSPAAYVRDIDTTESMALAFAALTDDAAYPIYFHCTYGRDRTGILAALILRALGANRADIMQEYLLSEPAVGAYPASLLAALDEVERRGGIEAYLASAGISTAQLARLRKAATAR